MKPEATYQVFTVHDPRLEGPKSVVYVGLTHRPDFNQCVTAVFREHLPDLKAELRMARKNAEVRRQGPRTDKATAMQLKYSLIAESEAAGSVLRHSPRSSGAPFRIVEDAEETMS